MRITRFRIENFRNIRLAECENPPDFMVICGGNGCGKTAFLQALMTAKEHAGAYGTFQHDPRAVSSDAPNATISMNLAFSDVEREFVRVQWAETCPTQDEIVIEIQKGGALRAARRSQPVMRLLGWYSRQFLNSPGFFDYFDAYRLPPKKDLSTWSAQLVSDDQAKSTLGAQGSYKFQFTKEYLASLAIRDAQDAQKNHRSGQDFYPDSLAPIRAFFDRFFAPMTFKDVRVDLSPFQYIIGTPRGDIDIDDLSAGEKEIFNAYIHFHQLQPKGSVILFDEADAHLHPDLERRYLEVLREIGQGNQVWLTTHSPEMMIAAGADSLYTVLKEPASPGGNQFLKVSGDETLHEVLSEIMGSRGLVSFNQRIIFIEGDDSSADREVYERLYPPGTHNVSFVPAGNSATVSKIAERVNQLLSSSTAFQQYYSIVDGDIERPERLEQVPDGASRRLFRLPVYHVENFLLEPEAILSTAQMMLGSACPYASAADVEIVLKDVVSNEQHLRPLAKALLDSRVALLAKQAYDAAFQKAALRDLTALRPSFEDALADAKRLMAEALADGSWKQKCKGREVLRGFCARHGLTYVHFRNGVIAHITPPTGLAEIMNQILQGGR